MRKALILGAGVSLALLAVLALVRLGTKYPGGILPKVHAQNGCALETLKGSYGFAGDGFTTSGPVPANITAFTPVASIGVDTFDGAGNVSGFTTGSLGGFIGTSPISGTYKVAADCTGSATVTTFGGLTHFSFVIVDNGKQLRNLGTDSGTVSFATATKQF